jgi:hypothetical protein
MPHDPCIKALARALDLECWESYSGQPVAIKRALDKRRTAALRTAQETVDEIFAENSPKPERSPMHAKHSTGFEFVLEDEPPRYHSSVMKIEMMLHFATIAGPFVPEAQRTSPAYTKFVKQLLADDLIERPTHAQRSMHPGWAYIATERGRAYVEALKDMQLPVALKTTTTWRIPE